MTQAFISYSRKDLAFVEQLAADLKAAGLDVWYDLSGLEGGAQWRIEIEKAIRGSQYVLIVLSPDSVVSEWVEREYLYANNLGKEIVPLFYKQCDLPLYYLNVHYIDVQGEKYQRNFSEILRSLEVNSLTNSEASPVKLPSSKLTSKPQEFKLPKPKINPLPEKTYGKIAFLEGNDYIIANSDNSDRFVVTKVDWSINSPRIAPGGGKLVFSSAYEDQESIYVINSDGSKLKRLTGPSDAKQDGYASWSPDATELIFSRGYSIASDIFIMDSEGNDQKNLTELYGKMSLNNFSEFPWSPDGERIIFSSNRNGTLNLYVMDKDGEKIERITNDSEINDYEAVWAPDGSTIAFVSTRGEKGETDIFTLNIDALDTEPINITDSPSHDTRPIWSPDGTQILFVSNRDGNRELYIMNRDGSKVQRITRTTDPKDTPSWLR